MAIIAILILIGLACDAFAARGRAEAIQVVAEDRIAMLLKAIDYLESHEKPAALAASPEYLAMKRVTAEAEQHAGDR